MKINNIENPALRSLMDKYDACPESRSWLGDRDLKTALAECPNISWIFWLAARMLQRQQFVLLVIAAVQPAMEFVSDDDDRPQACLDRLTAWANGDATLDDVQIAANATNAASIAAYAAAAAAEYASTAAYDANAAADYATAAAYHAANAAAAHNARIEMLNIIRDYIEIV